MARRGVHGGRLLARLAARLARSRLEDSVIARVLLAPVLVFAAALALLLMAAGFIELSLWLSGVLGLHHALGTDTQASENYAWSSGAGPMVIAALGFSGILATAWRRWNCHEAWCWRHGKYEVEGGVRCCDAHHPALDERPHRAGQRVRAVHRAHLEHLHLHRFRPSKG